MHHDGGLRQHSVPFWMTHNERSRQVKTCCWISRLIQCHSYAGGCSGTETGRERDDKHLHRGVSGTCVEAESVLSTLPGRALRDAGRTLLDSGRPSPSAGRSQRLWRPSRAAGSWASRKSEDCVPTHTRSCSVLVESSFVYINACIGTKTAPVAVLIFPLVWPRCGKAQHTDHMWPLVEDP
jgi:hypothetical protein